MITTLEEVSIERKRQDRKWGIQNHLTPKWMMILAEEVGEANKAALEGHMMEYRTELIQVAAVAIAAIESFDRNCVRDSQIKIY